MRYFDPLGLPSKQAMREHDRRQNKTNIQTCLKCNKEFDALDKKHDNEKLSVCYCSYQCHGKMMTIFMMKFKPKKDHILLKLRWNNERKYNVVYW